MNSEQLFAYSSQSQVPKRKIFKRRAIDSGISSPDTTEEKSMVSKSYTITKMKKVSPEERDLEREAIGFKILCRKMMKRHGSDWRSALEK
mmetsp:Transcript_26145/g.22994  ORF Transcript_26145/g.22994 Transcript_26145/m.22994 type:complete len:90 (+) Transcript_26145:73-342(+)